MRESGLRVGDREGKGEAAGRGSRRGGSEGKEEERTRVLQGPVGRGGCNVLASAQIHRQPGATGSLLGRHPCPGQQDPTRNMALLFLGFKSSS